MEAIIAQAREWLTKTNHKILEEKQSDDHAVLLVEHLRNTPGTAGLPPSFLLVMIETDKSLSGDFEARLKHAAVWASKDPRRSLGLFLPEGCLVNRSEFGIVSYYNR